MKILMPENVENIIKTLNVHGHEAYAVGGCIRDSILGRAPEDWDITTSASPAEVKTIFSRTIDTGLQHGTVTILLGKIGYEVTTYRVDGAYEDGRHPVEVTFTKSLEEDLKRRDFTINAMAYNGEQGLVDIFGGKSDLERKVIQCVGIASERFTEDALRMLRAVRFSAQLGFMIEKETLKAITELAKNLQQVSAERIQVELVKLLISPYPERFKIVYETGITKVMLPEFDRFVSENSATLVEEVLQSLNFSEPEKYLRLSILLARIENVKHILDRLKFDNQTKKVVTGISKYFDYPIELDEDGYGVRKVVKETGKELFALLIKVKEAYFMAQDNQKELEKLRGITRLYGDILVKNQCVSLQELSLSGDDLIQMGVKPGVQIGKILNGLLEEVIFHPSNNKKEILKKLVNKIEK